MNSVITTLFGEQASQSMADFDQKKIEIIRRRMASKLLGGEGGRTGASQTTINAPFAP